MYVKINTLPITLISDIRAAGYKKEDIEIIATESTNLSSCGGDGLKNFTILYNLETKRSQFLEGSWGGQNMFNNTIDDDRKDKPIPPNALIVKGYSGCRNFATIYVHPSTISSFLPEKTDITEEEKIVLAAYKCLISSARAEALERRGISRQHAEELALGLISRGFLSRNKAGATKITTEGKNAVGNYRIY